MNAEGKHGLSGAYWSEHWPYYKKEARAAELKKWKLETLEPEEGYLRARLRISKKNAALRGTAPFKLRLYDFAGGVWEDEPIRVGTLGKYALSPGCFGWIYFENGVAYEHPEEEA